MSIKEKSRVAIDIPDNSAVDFTVVSNNQEYTLVQTPTGLELYQDEASEFEWDPNLIFLDTETGGLDPNRHSLLQVGMYYPYGGLSLEMLVKDPTGTILPEALAVNGIDIDDVIRDGLAPEQAVERIENFLSRAHLAHPRSFEKRRKAFYMVGHNVAFDTAFVRRLFGQSTKWTPREFLYSRSIDTHSMLYLKGMPTSLDAALDSYGISTNQIRHTALGDAKITAELYRRLVSCQPSYMKQG